MIYEPIPFRRCPKCGDLKPRTFEHFKHPDNETRRLEAWCKPCVKGWHANEPKIIKGVMYIPQVLKRCSACQEWFLDTPQYFSAHGNGTSRGTCNICHRASVKKWKRDNPEKRRANNKRYSQKHPDVINAKSRRWRDRHPQRVKEITARQWAMNKEAMRRANRLWRETHRDAVIARKQRRRARELNAEGSFSGKDVQRQYQAQKGKCYWCNKKTDNSYQVDHVIPLSRGGTNWPSNIVIACPSCNASKKDKLPHEWGDKLL